MSTAETANNYYVCPFLAEMEMAIDAAATTVALAKEKVNIGGIDQMFATQLDAANSAKLLNSFTVSGGKQNPSGIDATGGYTDPSGNTLFVELSNVADFKDVIEAAIVAAANSAATPLHVADWLNSQLTESLTANILKTLGVNIRVSSSVTVDETVASANLAAGLTAAADLGEARCETMYLQIKQATLDLYRDASGNPSTAALPLAAGDKLVFVFDVAAPTEYDVTNKSEEVINSDGADTTALETGGSGVVGSDPAPTITKESGAGPYNWDSISVKYNGPVQRVSFEIQMAGASGVLADLKGGWVSGF